MGKSEILEAIRATNEKKEVARFLGVSQATSYRKITLHDFDA